MKSPHELLIVDDNPADIALAREALAACAYCGQISSVGDGAEALAFLNRRGPKRDGLAVLAAMKAGPDLRRIPVIIFSTSRLPKDVARSYELGANCYVSKPGNLTEFFSTMRSIEQFWFGSVSLPPRGE